MERHKTRLKAEFVKARVRRGCASVEDLKLAVLREKEDSHGVNPHSKTTAVYPRWIRINNLRTTLDKQLKSTFSGYKQVSSLAELTDTKDKGIYVDSHIPDLVAVAPGVDFSGSPAYRNGEIILQDKASCFPAYLLVGDADCKWEGDLIDGCAAPGNKTTHLASLLCKQQQQQHSLHHKSKNPKNNIVSMDASPTRSNTLQKMVSLAGADGIVTVLPGQDFLALDPADQRFADVTGLLLDPSCSGSGIVGRDDVPRLVLPSSVGAGGVSTTKSKKRKRGHDKDDNNTALQLNTNTNTNNNNNDENDILPTTSTKADPERLVKLSNLQARIVQHALSFSSATRVTYSTCSIHLIENEAVVSRVLASDVAKRRGWRVLRREEQPLGLRGWKYRGVRGENVHVDVDVDADQDITSPEVNLSDSELDACIRCWPGDEEGLGGFFVVGFVRDVAGAGDEDEDEQDEWEGFSD